MITELFEILNSEGWQALLRAFLHSIWIGLAILVVVIIALLVLPARLANLRYTIALAGQLSIAVAVIFLWAGFAKLHHTRTDTAGMPSASQVNQEKVKTYIKQLPKPSVIESDQTTQKQAESKTTVWFILAWWLGSFIFLARLIREANLERKLYLPVKVDTEAHKRIDQLVKQLKAEMHIKRKVTFRYVENLMHPAVAGVFNHHLFLPTEFVRQATPEILRAILAHELAHMKRYDYLVNLIQRIVESVLFFNPAIWVLGSLVRIERESCCDLAAANQYKSPDLYVEAIASWFAQNQITNRRIGLAQSADGKANSPIIDRVRRVLFSERSPGVNTAIPGILVAQMIVVVSVCLLVVFSVKATEILTPAERVAISEKLEIVPVLVGEERDTPFDVNITIRKPDGSVPTDTDLTEMGLVLQSTYGDTHSSSNYPAVANKVMKNKIGGLSTVGVFSKNWIPVQTPYASPKNGSDVLDIKIILRKGKKSEFRLVDEQGLPISAHPVRITFGRMGGSSASAISGENGKFALQLDKKQIFTVRGQAKNGFAEFSLDQYLSPGEVKDIVIQRATPFTLILRDESTGALIDSGVVHPTSGFAFYKTPHRGDHVISNGRVDITKVTKTEILDLCVSSKQGHRAFLNEISPADGTEQEFTIPSPRVISGWVDVKNLKGTKPGRDGKYTIDIDTSTWVKTANRTRGFGNEIKTQKVKDGRAHFSFYSWRGEVKLTCGNAEFKIEDVDSFDQPVILKGKSSPIAQPKKIDKKPAPIYRDIQLRLNTPTGDPKYNGKVKLGYNFMGSNVTYNIFKTVYHPVRDGLVELKQHNIAEPPFEMEVHCDGLSGYTLKRKTFYGDEESTPGSLKFEIDLVAAGGINGIVFDSDNKPAANLYISVQRDKQLSKGNGYSLPSNISTKGNQFFASPIPMDTWHRVIARSNNSWIISEPIKVDTATPFTEIALTYTKGETLSGTVKGASGAWLKNQQVRLNMTHQGWSYSGDTVRTNGIGEFRFNEVILDQGLTYSIEVLGKKNSNPIHKSTVNNSKPSEIAITVE